ncbi:MAG: hypothetical protein GWN47_00220 [Woeseiaceae bacterium]|nr:hypothetical protein [Woeseiaceae bacterium]
MKKLFSLVAIALVGTGAWYAWTSRHVTPEPWTADEIELIRSLWIGSLSPLPEDESNAVSDSEEAARLGYQLFFDPRLSGNGGISCATCHQPERQFTDGLPKGQAIGTSRRNTRSIIGVAYSPWLYWDGRKDSLWSQALAPLEDPNEHGTDRVHVVSVIAADPGYRATYESLFSAAPDEHDVDRAFTNIGKVIAAYERLLLPGPSRFDHYVEAIMTGRETRFTACACLSARRTAPSATMVRCSRITSSTIRVCFPFRETCRTRAACKAFARCLPIRSTAAANSATTRRRHVPSSNLYERAPS